MGVLLGNVLLDGFEVSARISFGGAQALAVHKLPGGGRVIDAMGPDDDLIAWHGILSGSDATDRARALDAMRVDGSAVSLSWDVFSALVIVSDLKLEFRNSWWIPYQIACTTLLGTQGASVTEAADGVLSDILADLAQAGLAPGVDGAIAAVSAVGTGLVNTPAYAGAVTALLGAQGAISQSIASIETGIGSLDLPDLVSASGSLATLTAASGYVGRATANFVDAGM